jgi:branched-chain amino acid transport system ATP-binding protein
MNNNIILEVENITTGYGQFKVIDDVSFNINDKDIVVLTGDNGSGKSTILKCIFGLIKAWPPVGKIIFKGVDIVNIPTYELAEKGIIYIPQVDNYFENMNFIQNLSASGSLYTHKARIDKENQILSLPYINALKNSETMKMSGGEKQLVAISNALMHSPQLILFDEPFQGLDQHATENIKEVIIDLNKKGITFLIVEHKSILNKFANSILRINEGKIK